MRFVGVNKVPTNEEGKIGWTVSLIGLFRQDVAELARNEVAANVSKAASGGVLVKKRHTLYKSINSQLRPVFYALRHEATRDDMHGAVFGPQDLYKRCVLV